MSPDPCPYCADTGWFYSDPELFPCPMCEEGNKMAARRNAPAKDKADQFPQIKIITPPLQLSYPKIFDPEENDQGKDVWETDALVPPGCRYPKNHPKYPGKLFEDVLLDALDEVMVKQFGPEEDWPRGRNDYEPKDKLKYVKKDKLPHPSIDLDTQVFRARSYQPVGIVDADKNDVTSKREAYGGRWAKLSITVTVYSQPQSKGPAIYLNNVQLLDNAESFGGRSSPDQDFEVEESENGRGSGRRGGDRDRDDDRGERGRDAGEDRGRGRGRDRDDDSRDSRRDDRRDSGRNDRDEDDGRGGRDRGGRTRDDRADDRGRGRGRDREDEEDRDARGGSRSRRDEGDRRSSREEEEGEGRSRGRDRDDDRGGRAGRGGRDSDERVGRDREEERGGRGRGSRTDRDERDQEDDDRGGRGRGRDRGDSRDRDDERGSRGRDEEGGRGSRGDRERSSRDQDEEDDDRPSSRGGSSRGSRDDRWN